MVFVFLFKQKTAYEMRISDWSSDVCSSDLRGDLLSLSLARLQRIAPDLRRVALSANVADVDSYRAWLAPDGDIKAVMPVIGEPGAEPNIDIILPEDSVPLSGHRATNVAHQVFDKYARQKTNLLFFKIR